MTVAARPDRSAIDPLLAEHEPRRIVVAGTDADLAAVVLRLLRTDRLGIEVAYLPSARSPFAARWGLPRGRAAAALATTGTAGAAPLIRDDAGGVLMGRGEVRSLRGECYCDQTLVLRGSTRRLVVQAGADVLAVRAGRRLDGKVRPVAPLASSGRGSAVGRAVQVGGEPMIVVHDGVEHPRPVARWTWYRHTSDWLLVRPR